MFFLKERAFFLKQPPFFFNPKKELICSFFEFFATYETQKECWFFLKERAFFLTLSKNFNVLFSNFLQLMKPKRMLRTLQTFRKKFEKKECCVLERCVLNAKARSAQP